MAGIYIHIPFCKSRCIYCDFYSTTLLERRGWYVRKLCEEMTERSGWLGQSDYSTVYVGGGTPSRLSFDQLRRMIESIHQCFSVRSDCEFTVEVNPDDVSRELVRCLVGLGVNRVSMGVQTFSDDRLRFLRRRHSSQQALQAVCACMENGIENVSIDLMFGFPDESLADWESDLDKALTLGVKHISAYSLMYEEGTPMTRMLEEGNFSEIDDELSALMYQMLLDKTATAGFEHYEISNFCKPGYHSRHNSGYWDGTPYIGLGAGAHSFNGYIRQWNGQMTRDGWSVEGYEELTLAQVFNETIMTGLRTARGIDTEQLQKRFPDCFRSVEPEIEKYVRSGKLQRDSLLRRVSLTRQGLLVSNAIMADLMVVE